MLLSCQATSSISNGNLSALDSLAAKHGKLQAIILLTLKQVKFPMEHHNFKSKTLSPVECPIVPYSMGNHKMLLV